MSVLQWIDDQLHAILGYSEAATTHYLLAVAKKSTDAEHFVSQVSDSIDAPPDALRRFAGELLQRVPHAAPRAALSSSARGPSALEQRNMDMRRLNASLKPIEADSDDEDEPVVSKSTVFEAKSKKSSKALRKRKQESSSSESSDDDALSKSNVDDGGAASEDDDIERMEAEAEADAAERDALARRIREREKANTRHVLSKSERKAADEAARRLNIAADSTAEGSRQDLLAKLRDKSRKEYLAKRKEDKTLELQYMVHDDEQIFAHEDLTERERRDIKYRKEVLQYVKQYDKADDIVKVERYHVPDGSVKAVPDHYVEEAELPGGDGRRWEEERLHSAVFKTGAKDRKSKKETALNDLLIEDEQIDFVELLSLPGIGDKPKKPELTATQKKKLTLDEVRKSLPVYLYRESFLEAVSQHQVIIIEGQTGSGKTTQLPQYLYEAGYCSGDKKLGCTQPRRVAAMSVAARVTEEVGTKLGDIVGYTIRFEDCSSERTKLKYMTDGMLLREFLNEPDLASYSVLMIDEAHERTLHTDVLFGLVKDIARYRKDLKLLISSATLDADKFSGFFDGAPIFRIPGRRFPVGIYYTKAPEADYLDAAMVSILQIHLTQPLPGDILVFLTGQEEIETVQEALQERVKLLGSRIKELVILPVYANLPSDMQAKIFEPTPLNARKVVLATNIAETSVTIDGIIYVIDPGFVKQNSYDARSGVEHLNVVTISKAAADQRAGRAGRTGPGKCFRLYTSWAYKNELESQPVPEVSNRFQIQRTNLGSVVLMLLSLGITDLVHFDFLDPPPYETLAAALEHLYALGALNHKGALTKLGRRMAEFPCFPEMSKMIIASEKYGCSEEIITIAAMLSVNAAIFYRPKAMIVHADTARKGFWSPNGDHLTLLNVYNKWKETNFSTQWCAENFVQIRTMKRARDIRDQLEGLLERVEIEPKSSDDPIAICKAICAGYFYNLATFDKGGNYKTVKHRHTVQIHPNSSLFEERPRWLLYYELVFTSKEFMREVIEVDSRWIAEVAPHFYKSNELESEATKKMPKAMGRTKQELDR